MALSQSEIDARITALRKSMDAGVFSVRSGDEFTQFRTLAEMESLLARLQGELDALTGTTRRPVRYIRQRGQGFC